MSRHHDFQEACTAMLVSLGATPGDRCYPWRLMTLAGVLHLRPLEDWLACRFQDVQAAKQVVGRDRLNRYSGKWNWHFTDPTTDDLENLRRHLHSLLPVDSSTPSTAQATDAAGCPILIANHSEWRA